MQKNRVYLLHLAEYSPMKFYFIHVPYKMYILPMGHSKKKKKV